MEQSTSVKRLSLILTLAATAVLCGFVVAAARRPTPRTAAVSQTVAPLQQLSPDGQASLRDLVQSGNLAELRWPDFSDYEKHVQKFYEMYGYSLPWVRDMQPTEQARQIISTLSQAEQKGLSAEDYDASRWAGRLAKLKPLASQTSEADAIQFDAALTVCIMRYISDLHIGKVNPKHFDFGFDIETKKYDLPEFLKENVVDASDIAAALAQVEPPYPGYQRTILALHNYLALAKMPDSKPLPEVKKTIGPGDTYAGVPQLASLLQRVGDLPAEASVPADATIYDGPLVDAVKKFQLRHGRDADGRIGATTLADLNVPISSRVRQMQLMLERWRWLPISLHAAPIVANIPEFRLRAYDENFKIALTMNVVVGKSFGHKTPLFEDTMEYAVFRPYWNVPYSITKNEMLPKIAKDPNYLTSKGLEVVNSKQEVVVSGPVSSDVLAQVRAGKLFIREQPGPKNSLGLAKFIFPNSHNVYMHDTPARQLFSQSRRDFSHGCIRLERPADLGAWVLRNNPGWDAERVRAAMNGTTTQQVNLAKPIPVLIVYGTAIVSEDGLVHFYDDIYGLDAELQKVLDKGYPYPN